MIDKNKVLKDKEEKEHGKEEGEIDHTIFKELKSISKNKILKIDRKVTKNIEPKTEHANLSARSKQARRPRNDSCTIPKEDVGGGGDCPPRFPLRVMKPFHHKCPAEAVSVKN